MNFKLNSKCRVSVILDVNVYEAVFYDDNKRIARVWGTTIEDAIATLKLALKGSSYLEEADDRETTRR